MDKEKIEVIDDLKLISEYMNKNDMKFLFLVINKNEPENKCGTHIIQNLELSDLVVVMRSIKTLIERKIELNDCECKGCNNSIMMLKKYLNVGDESK